jgi:hypothetical protein
MLNRFVILSMVMTSCVLAASSKVQAAPIYNPDPIQVPCEMPLADVKKALWLALVGRTWNPVETAPGVVEAKVVVRTKHTLVVDIKYDTKSVLIRYKSSDNLDYRISGGVPHIHKNGNSWIRNIENDTRNNLVTSCKFK